MGQHYLPSSFCGNCTNMMKSRMQLAGEDKSSATQHGFRRSNATSYGIERARRSEDYVEIRRNPAKYYFAGLGNRFLEKNDTINVTMFCNGLV